VEISFMFTVIVFKIALNLWRSTGSILTWIHKQFLNGATYVITSDEVEDGLNVGLSKSICASTFKNDIAHMTIDIVSPRVLEVQRDVKVTFPDMLGTIGKCTHFDRKHIVVQNLTKMYVLFSGGTIGLFTGLSLISIIEFVYWVYITVVDYFSH
jgi:hypothetical protein